MTEKHKRSNDEIGNELRWKKYPVLDDGFICLVDWMGDDSSIANAARVSYGNGTKKTSDDEHLLNYLMRHQHHSPFEMASIVFMIRVPMDTWRQFVRHRTAKINEYSTRYSIAIDSAQETKPDSWRKQSQSNRQGSSGYLDDAIGASLSDEEAEFHMSARRLYQKRIDAGIAREQARKDLPLCTYTEAYWNMDLRNLLHFLALRMDDHAQKEIRDYAYTIGETIVAKMFPLTWNAFKNNVLNAVTLTNNDIACLSSVLTKNGLTIDEHFLIDSIKKSSSDYGLSEWSKDHCRERDEFIDKANRIGFINWNIK